jgi:DNA-binding response OmpR family regulator
MAVLMPSLKRSVGEDPEFLEARDGVRGAEVARRSMPDAVIADEISSRAGAFALARDLRNGEPAFEGLIAILLDRKEDEWLARWSGADSWFVKPVNPFEVADTITAFVDNGEKEAV